MNTKTSEANSTREEKKHSFKATRYNIDKTNDNMP